MIPIPHIVIRDAGVADYRFADFSPDLTVFTESPVRTEQRIQSLIDAKDQQRVSGAEIDFDGYHPLTSLIEVLCEKPEIDYHRCAFKVAWHSGDRMWDDMERTGCVTSS